MKFICKKTLISSGRELIVESKIYDIVLMPPIGDDIKRYNILGVGMCQEDSVKEYFDPLNEFLDNRIINLLSI